MTDQEQDSAAPAVERQFRVVVGQGYASVADLNKQKVTRRPPGTTPRATAPATRQAGRSSTTFSRNSRNALIKALNDLAEPPTVFATLAYPVACKHDPAAWKRDLDRLRRRIGEDYAQAWFFWRLEPHPDSGRPHFHLLGGPGEGVMDGEFWSWLQGRWCCIIGTTPEKSPFACEVKPVSGELGALSRYFSKEEESAAHREFASCWADAGTRWGKIGKKNFPDGPRQEFIVSGSTYAEIKDMILASIQGELNALEDQLKNAGDFTPYRLIFTLKESIAGKRKHMSKIIARDDYFSVLSQEHRNMILDLLAARETK